MSYSFIKIKKVSHYKNREPFFLTGPGAVCLQSFVVLQVKLSIVSRQHIFTVFTQVSTNGRSGRFRRRHLDFRDTTVIKYEL